MRVGAIKAFTCLDCGTGFEKFVTIAPDGNFPNPLCKHCSSPSTTLAGMSSGRNVSVPLGEEIVYYEHPDGQITIPGHNRFGPMHSSLPAAGFVRKEIRTVHELTAFETRTGKISEVNNFNRGSSTRRPDGLDE